MAKTLNKISVIGAGAWGSALAHVLAEAGRNVTLYARSAHLAAAINKDRRNPLYLPDAPLSRNIRATHDAAEAVKDAEIALLVVPAQHMRATMAWLKPHLPHGIPLVLCSKGIEIETGKLLSEVANDELPGQPVAVLSGPTFADEVAKGLPAAVTLATTADETEAKLWAEALHGKSFRPYLSKDPAGAEIGGALKNVVAIACGIVEGRGLGLNARAAVMTRGMAEIVRFGLLKGASAETFLGLSGIGDLTLTCNAMESRNFSLGHALGRGEKLADVLSARRSVAEGVSTARAVTRLASRTKADMPICQAVDHILHAGGNIDEVVTGLLSRNLRSEGG